MEFEDIAGALLAANGISRDNKLPRSKVHSALKIATVDPNYSGYGWACLQFAGESSVGSRTYPSVSSYHPTAGDRVVVALFSHSGIILGKIDTPTGYLKTGPNGLVDFVQSYDFGNPGSDQYVFLGRLPADSSSTYDHMRVEVVGSSWVTSTDMINDWYLFSNRNGFTYQSERAGLGDHTANFVEIKAYKNADNTVDIYARSPATAYTATVIKILGMDIGTGPFAIGAVTTTVPSGTVIFDSNTAIPKSFMGWNTVSYQNGWADWNDVNYGAPLTYTKTSDGVVVIRGLAESPTTGGASPSSNATVFNLPAGYRPGKNLIFMCNAGDAAFSMQITSGGDVQVRSTIAASSWVSLDNVSFIAEA